MQILFEKISTRQIYAEVVDQVLKLLRDGTLKVGDQLPSEAQLTEQLGVSRSSVREALKALEILGVIDSKTGVGRFVRMSAPLSDVRSLLDELTGEGNPLEILEARKVIEPGVALLAATRRTEDDLQALKAVLLSERQEVDQGKLGLESDLQFHILLGQASKNRVLSDAVRLLMERRRRSFWQPLVEEHLDAERLQVSFVDTHWEILACVEAQKAQEASDAMLRHLQSVKDDLEL